MVEARREDERYGFVRTRDAAFGDDLDRVVAEGMLPARRRVEIRNDAPMDLRLEACVLPVKVEHAADPSELLAEFAGGLVGLSLRWRLDDPFSDDTMVTRARSVVRVCGTPARRAVGVWRRLKGFLMPRRYYDSLAELKQAVSSALSLLGAVELQC